MQFYSKIFIILAFLLLSVTCGRDRSSPVATTSLRGQVAQRVEAIRPQGLLCGGDVAKDIEDPVVQDCNDGDNLAFNGMLCASGEDLGCQSARRSFDGQRFWRSPRRVGNPLVNDFSRDMFLGALLYLVTTKDLDTAKRYRTFIVSSGGRLCAVDTDGRCNMTPITWNLFNHVLRFLEGESISKVWEPIDWTLDRVLIKAAEEVPLGYQLELVTEEVWIRQLAGSYTKDLQQVMDVVIRRDPANPFHSYIRSGATDAVAEQYLSICPVAVSGPRIEWLWASSAINSAINQSMRWDCVMLGNLLKR